MKQLFIYCDKDITETPTLSRVNPQSLPCASCGSTQQTLGAGKAPGEASLLCECGKFIKWISANEVKAIADQVNNGGQR